MDYDFELQILIEALADDDRIQSKEQKKWRSLMIRRMEEIQAFANMLELPIDNRSQEKIVGDQMMSMGASPAVNADELPEEFKGLASHLQPGETPNG